MAAPAVLHAYMHIMHTTVTQSLVCLHGARTTDIQESGLMQGKLPRSALQMTSSRGQSKHRSHARRLLATSYREEVVKKANWNQVMTSYKQLLPQTPDKNDSKSSEGISGLKPSQDAIRSLLACR